MKKTPSWLHALFQKRMLIVLALGFASGLPLGLTMTTLQAWYVMDGVDIVTIGFLGLVGQPYVYKFMWAPAMDKWQIPFLGRRRGWMLCTQGALIVALCWMAFLNPSEKPYFLAFLALAVAFLSSSQDIAVDAYRTELLAPKERGIGTAMAVSGYRIAMLVSGGLTLIMAEFVGFQVTYLVSAALMGVGLLATLYATEPKYHESPPSFFAACVDPFKEFLTRPHALALLAFIVLYKLGDAFAGSLTTAFLLKGVGFSLVDVGLTNKTVGLAATLLGVFVGGVMMLKMGLFRALLIFGILQALTNLLFLSLTYIGQNLPLMALTLFLENFAGGLGTAAFMTLIMSMCDPRFTATQFALLSSLTAVGRVFVGPLSGVLVAKVGWAEFFIWSVIFAIPGLALLWKLRGIITEYGTRREAESLSEGIEEAKASA